MGYTRYNFKRNKGKSNKRPILGFFAGVIILAIVSCALMFKFTLDNPAGKEGTKVSSKTARFIAVQGGMFAKEENVEKEKAVLSSYGIPFVVKEGEVTRVFSGLYLEDNFRVVMDSMDKNGKSNSKMIFTLNKNDLCDTEIAELVTANTRVLNKLSEPSVKGIQTKEFKAWAASLKKPDSGKNLKALKAVLEYIEKLPEELTREKAPDNYFFLYNILKDICEISK